MKKLAYQLHKLGVLFVALVIVSSYSYAQTTSEKITQSIAFLTEGVGVLPQCGLPGPIMSIGDNSFPVVLGQYESAVYEPVVSAAFVGKGRVVAFGHTDYCSVSTIGSTQSATQFFNNAIFWVSSKEDSKNGTTAKALRVAVWRDAKTAEFLKRQGFDAVVVTSIQGKFDVFIAGAVALSDQDYDKIFEAVNNGAGLITCGLGWGWSQLNPNKNLVADHAGNKNFAKYGVSLAWTDGTLDATTQGGYSVSSQPNINSSSSYVNGMEVLKYLESLNSQNSSDQVASLRKEERRQISSTANLIYRHLPEEKKTIYKTFVDSVSAKLQPTSKNPIQSDSLIERLAISLQTESFLREQVSNDVAAKDVPKLDAGDDFPGKVPENAERLNSIGIKVKTAVPEWASTGLYAAPGETITVSLPQEILKKSPMPFKVRIGVHSDTLWHLAKWERYPEITLEKVINSEETQITNPFGGLIYIVVPRGIKELGLGTVEFQISGAVAAPYFIQDETSLTSWKTLRDAPAPWAELQGKEVIVTVPSEVIRGLDDPQALTETWDKILRFEAEFASGPYYRERPERIVCDRQISAGYMHSGYPVMTHMDVKNVLVDNQRLLTRGDWGFFHEFGHNHQSDYWTFDGSGEVTVNYFTLYIMEKLCGLSPEQTRGELSKENRIKLLKRYFANGTQFKDWKADPFLALNMTVQLRNEFGWEPFLRAVSEYQKAAPNELPRTDAEKRDQWLVRLSRNVNKNLGPFFEKWGVPTSQEARDSIKEFPVWLPDEFDEL